MPFQNKIKKYFYHEPPRTITNIRKIWSKSSCGWWLPFLIFFFFSCQTAPKIPEPFQDSFIPLNPGATAYLYADVQAARPVLEILPIDELKDKRLAQILDQTRTVLAAQYPAESGRPEDGEPKNGQHIQLVAWGKYPKAQADLAFAFNKDWKKKRSANGFPYWYSKTDKLSVAMTARRAHVSLNDTSADPFGLNLPSTAEFDEACKGAALACWLANPGPLLDNIFASMNLQLQLPAEQIYLSIFPMAGKDNNIKDNNINEKELMQKYQVLLCIKTSNANQARLIANSLSLLRFFSGASANSPPSGGSDIVLALLLANAPVQDGSKIKIKSAPLGLTDLALLFKQISLYSITK